MDCVQQQLVQGGAEVGAFDLNGLRIFQFNWWKEFSAALAASGGGVSLGNAIQT